QRKALLAGEASFFQMEKRYLHKDGHAFWGLANVSLVRDSKGTVRQYVGQVQDITHQKQAETRLRMIIDSAPSGMVMINRQGNIALVNAETEKQFGYSRDELLG